MSSRVGTKSNLTICLMKGGLVGFVNIWLLELKFLSKL